MRACVLGDHRTALSTGSDGVLRDAYCVPSLSFFLARERCVDRASVGGSDEPGATVARRVAHEGARVAGGPPRRARTLWTPAYVLMGLFQGADGTIRMC